MTTVANGLWTSAPAVLEIAIGKNRSINMLATKKGDSVRSSTKIAITSVSSQRPVLVKKPKPHNEMKARSRCRGTSDDALIN